MAAYLCRSVHEPIRTGLSWSEQWTGSDGGLIWCWERGRQLREKNPKLAARACKDKLVPLDWKRGTFQYLATWQGLRGEDLHIVLESETRIVCAKTGKRFRFRADVLEEEASEGEATVTEPDGDTRSLPLA